MPYIGDGETIAATFDNDPEVLEFVYYLEAREGEGRAVTGTVEGFLATLEKSKWKN